MSVDFTKPVATADRAQNLTDTKDTLVAVAKQLDDTTPTGVATGMIRWSSANSKWQKYNGTSWVDLAATFSMNVSSLGGQAAANYLLAATAASTYLAKSGGTMTGLLTLSGAPTADLHAATKKYADDKVAALPTLVGSAWSPTASTTSNISSHTVLTAQYSRVGDIVHFMLTLECNPTAAGTNTTLGFPLPVASGVTGSYIGGGGGGVTLIGVSQRNAAVVTVTKPSGSGSINVAFFSANTSAHYAAVVGMYRVA